MAKNIVVVESPAKAKTIRKYLGNDFNVFASYGHVRDLLPKAGSVDTDHDFAMHYELIERNAKHVTEIAKSVKSADSFYLATDPDREGEAIAWHICETLKSKKVLKKQPIYRIVFHEITKSAITNAVNNPRDIDMHLVDAQSARRALDYLVGFNLSPLLWKKICYGLSAGRVQSPALRMIVEREQEIKNFVCREYWSIVANCIHSDQKFLAKLIIYNNEKLDQFSITKDNQAKDIECELLSLASGKLLVSKVDKKTRIRNPSAPFITSTLQQEASRKLGFSAKQTMRTAQTLYEAGYITYMRTDSVNLAQEAIAEIRETIEKQFGSDYLPESPRLYKTKSKSAQEAHEAIRPTKCSLLPQSLPDSLRQEQIKLYTLIWQRSIACQMVSAVFDTVSVDLSCGDSNVFRANGSVITNPGFLKIYREGVEQGSTDDKDEKILPVLKVGDIVDLLGINSNQHFTEPPPRYSEASLVKTLEEHGIGRPSTYAAIIDTLLTRKYVILENKRFKPTDTGEMVNDFLVKYFPKYVDYKFTAELEDDLDAVAHGKNNFLTLMNNFWGPFKELINDITNNVKKSDITQKVLDYKCPKCGNELILRFSKNGKFIGCSGYPNCDYTANINREKDTVELEIVKDRLCPKCNSQIQIKTGKYGKFIGCSSYPKCNFIEPFEKPFDTKISCPICKTGSLLKRKSRFNKYFYSCSQYPKCKYAIWNEPILEPCPKCGWPLLTIKITKKHGKEKICPQKDCDYGKK